MSGPSLGRRLQWRLLWVFAAGFIASCGGFLALAWLHPTVEIEAELGHLADELAATGAPGAELLRRLEGFRYVVIEPASGQALAQSKPPLFPYLPALPRAGDRRMAFSVSTNDAHPVRLDGYLAEREAQGRKLLAAVATERAAFWEPLRWVYDELSEDVLPVGIPLLIVSLVVTAVTIRRTLKPVALLSEQAGVITPRTTGLRLNEAAVPSEVLPLVTAFNATLERLDRGFLIQRRFTANAAHQLRTPLAILRARLDGLPADTETAALKRDCDRIARVMSQLLSIAQLEAHQIEIGENVDLCRLAEETVSAMAPLAIAAGHALALDAGEPVVVRGNSAALGDALRNLIENAMRFAPPGSAVEVAVRPQSAQHVASIAVLDRGTGVPEDARTRVFEPFWRGGDPRGPGSGLGLAIVAEVAAAHGGRALVVARDGGGAEFRIELPQIIGTDTRPALAAQ